MLCQDDRITDQSMEEIPCGNQTNFNSLSLINSPISQNMRNALLLLINCRYRRSLLSPSITLLNSLVKSTLHYQQIPISDHTSLIYKILRSLVRMMFDSIWNHLLCSII